ncbi:hypothetical protein AAHE18_08G096300 [Arachis hypogaea]
MAKNTPPSVCASETQEHIIRKKQSKLRNGVEKNAETNSNTTTPIVASSKPSSPISAARSTLTLTPIPNSQYHRLLNFLKTHLSPPFTPESLLHFLKSKLHDHPSFSHYDFHVFTWASFVDSFRHTHSTFHWMAQTLALSHPFHHLRLLLDFIASNPCPCSDSIFSCPHTESIFRFAIHAYCKAGKLDEAVSSFRSMCRLIDGRPNVAVCNIIIHGFVKFGMLDRALEFYDEIVRVRVRPDLFTFNILISGYCRNLKFELALEMFKEMRKMGCEPNVVTFNTLIKEMFREGKVEEGIGMAHEMIDLGCEFSNVTCEILVRGLGEKGKVLQAYELLLDFSKRGVLPKGYDYFDLVDALCGNGDVDRALGLIYELWEKGCVPSLIACIVMIDGLRSSRKTKEAWRLVEKMLKEGIIPDVITFNCVLQDICKVGQTEEANKLRLLAFSKVWNLMT